jgi:HK97 gp10 family phage protein
MSGFRLQIKGVDELLNKLDISPIKKEIKVELKAFGQEVERDAKQLAPVDEGYLKSRIYHKATNEAGGIVMEVGCTADYAAYVEFGTRKFAASYVSTLPPDWQSYAATFKGSGTGDYFEFLNAILDWVLRKGIANRYSVKTKKAIKIKLGGKGKKSLSDQDRLQQTAYAIALSIIRNGIKPHPFLYPAFEKNRILLIQRLEAVLNER